MRVPHTVPRNTLRAYSVPEQAETVSARRVQAENFTWDERMPPSLSSLCVRALVSSFTENSEALSSLGRQDLDFLLEVLPTDLDIDVVAPIVEDGIYWQRCCEYRWPERPLDVSKHGGSWRRMLLEKYLQHYIEDLQPEQVDLEDFEKKINVCSPFIIRLELRELKPPKNVYESRESSLTTSSCSHLDLSYVLSRLNNIEELILQFGVRNCGMDFNPKLFSISSRDIENLVKGIQQNHSLILLKIHRSSINDAKLNIIVSGVVEMKNLTILDFSHCQIGDKGAGYLAKFIKAQGTLKKLNLSNNRIGAEGVEKFADLLGSEEEVCPVECLVLDFNLIGDEGSISLAAALLKNETLLDLKLQGTGMQNKGVLALADALLTNCTLLHLDASNNHLTVKCSAALMATLNSNKTLLTFDIRNCGIDKITELSVHKYVQRNRMASRYANQ